jgi:hypothetical protein
VMASLIASGEPIGCATICSGFRVVVGPVEFMPR